MKHLIFASIAVLFAATVSGQFISPNKVGTYSTSTFTPTGNYIGAYLFTSDTDTSGSINFVNKDGGTYKLTAPSVANGSTSSDVLAGQSWVNTNAAPVYGVGVFASATTATVTTTAIKANSIVQVGWYGSTVPSYSVTPSVPTTTIADGSQFVVKSSVSTSDSFYYLIFNHN